MNHSQQAKKFFCQAAARSCWHQSWIPNTGWGIAIEQTSGKKFTNTVIAITLNSIIDNEGSSFVHEEEEFVISRNRRYVDKGDRKKGNVHFYWIQPASISVRPVVPVDTPFWQQCFGRHSTPRGGTLPQTRPKRKASKQRSSKRQKITKPSPQEKRLGSLDLTQEQVNKSVDLVTNKSKSSADNWIESPPKTREELKAMMQKAWHTAHPTVPFPDEMLSSNESTSRTAIVSVSSDSETEARDATETERREDSKPKMCGRYHVEDVTLSNGYVIKDVPKNYTVVSKGDFKNYECERAIVAAARMIDHIPFDDVKLVYGHQDMLDEEIRHRRNVPYLPDGFDDKLQKPIPTLNPEKFKGVDRSSFEGMTFTQKKNWLKADEMYRYRMNWLLQNDFSGDVDMKKFDTKTFKPMNPDVVFEVPDRA